MVTPTETSEVVARDFSGPVLREQAYKQWPLGLMAFESYTRRPWPTSRSEHSFFAAYGVVSKALAARLFKLRKRLDCRQRQMDVSRRQDGFTDDGYFSPANSLACVGNFMYVGSIEGNCRSPYVSAACAGCRRWKEAFETMGGCAEGVFFFVRCFENAIGVTCADEETYSKSEDGSRSCSASDVF
ncbi:hypothetical protein MRX96_001167 [Rhipicephalus microplus]